MHGATCRISILKFIIKTIGNTQHKCKSNGLLLLAMDKSLHAIRSPRASDMRIIKKTLLFVFNTLDLLTPDKLLMVNIPKAEKPPKVKFVWVAWWSQFSR